MCVGVCLLIYSAGGWKAYLLLKMTLTSSHLPVFQASVAPVIQPVICPLCGKQLSGINGRQKLRYHLLTHTGERKFACPHCPYRAALKFNLSTHMRNIHQTLYHRT